jgi:biopolymer transport protein ExbB/TolQ
MEEAKGEEAKEDVGVGNLSCSGSTPTKPVVLAPPPTHLINYLGPASICSMFAVYAALELFSGDARSSEKVLLTGAGAVSAAVREVGQYGRDAYLTAAQAEQASRIHERETAQAQALHQDAKKQADILAKEELHREAEQHSKVTPIPNP